MLKATERKSKTFPMSSLAVLRCPLKIYLTEPASINNIQKGQDHRGRAKGIQSTGK